MYYELSQFYRQIASVQISQPQPLCIHCAARYITPSSTALFQCTKSATTFITFQVTACPFRCRWNYFSLYGTLFYFQILQALPVWPKEILSIYPLVQLPTSTHRLQYLNLRHNRISFCLQIRLTLVYYFKREFSLYPLILSFPSSLLLPLWSYFWKSLISSCRICCVPSLLSPIPTILQIPPSPHVTILTHVTFRRCVLACLTSYMTFSVRKYQWLLQSDFLPVPFIFVLAFFFSFHTYIRILLHM